MTCCLWQDLNGKQQDWEAVVLIPFMEEERLLAAMQPLYPRLTDIHSIRLRRNEEGLFLHYHCRCAPGDSVEQIHDDIDRVEAGLKDRFGDIRRVIAHAEPLGARRHAL